MVKDGIKDGDNHCLKYIGEVAAEIPLEIKWLTSKLQSWTILASLHDDEEELETNEHFDVGLANFVHNFVQALHFINFLVCACMSPTRITYSYKL